jgi:hypothetical protein
MSTFQQLQDRITADYLNRTDLNAETGRAIQAAVRKYERKRFWFNETSTSVACVASQSYVAVPSNFLDLDLLQVQDAGSANVELIEKDLKWIKRANTVPTYGIPTHFTIYQNRIELFPIPNSAYSLPIYYLHKFPTLSAGADTSEWTSAIEDVIVYHATKLMWATVLRNPDQANIYQSLEQEALVSVLAEKEQRQLTRIKPTKF